MTTEVLPEADDAGDAYRDAPGRPIGEITGNLSPYATPRRPHARHTSELTLYRQDGTGPETIAVVEPTGGCRTIDPDDEDFQPTAPGPPPGPDPLPPPPPPTPQVDERLMTHADAPARMVRRDRGRHRVGLAAPWWLALGAGLVLLGEAAAVALLWAVLR